MGTIACIAILALAANEVPSVVFTDLLPRPQQVTVTAGEFTIPDSPLGFVIEAPDKDAGARLQARLRESQERLGIERGVNIVEITPRMFGLAIFSGDAEPKPIGPYSLHSTGDRGGYLLEISPAGIRVAAKAEQGLFYGMMTAEQLLESARVHKLASVPCANIFDWPALAMRGYHEDYGRDQLPTVEDHKRTVRTLAQFKMNTHLWFIESDHFVYKFDPELGKSHDRFTFDELKEVAEYAKNYYIEVIPVVELLAHMENTLNDPKYAHLAEREGSGIICPTSEESIKFVENIINEIAPNFPGNYFHCALDESQEVGKGKSADAIKEKGIERVYADYYTRLNDTVKANGKTMMMYADIVLNHPDVIPMLPHDIVMMYWDYIVKDDHPGLEAFVKNGFTTVSLSGMWDWANLYPLYAYSLKNIEQLAVKTAEQKALGTFVSNWGDWNLGAAGANLSEVTLFGATYCGVEGWKPEPIDIPAYSAAFAVQYFGALPEDAGVALTLLAKSQGDTLYGNQKARRMSVSDPAEQLPALAAASEEDIQYWRNMKDCAGRAHLFLKKSAPRLNADYLGSHDLCARMLEFSADLALQYRETALAQKQPDFNGRAHAEKYQALKDRQWALWEEYRDVYLATNKPINIRYLITAWENSQQALDVLIKNLQDGASN